MNAAGMSVLWFMKDSPSASITAASAAMVADYIEARNRCRVSAAVIPPSIAKLQFATCALPMQTHGPIRLFPQEGQPERLP